MQLNQLQSEVTAQDRLFYNQNSGSIVQLLMQKFTGTMFLLASLLCFSHYSSPAEIHRTLWYFQFLKGRRAMEVSSCNEDMTCTDNVSPAQEANRALLSARVCIKGFCHKRQRGRGVSFNVRRPQQKKKKKKRAMLFHLQTRFHHPASLFQLFVHCFLRCFHGFCVDLTAIYFLLNLCISCSVSIFHLFCSNFTFFSVLFPDR